MNWQNVFRTRCRLLPTWLKAQRGNIRVALSACAIVVMLGLVFGVHDLVHPHGYMRPMPARVILVKRVADPLPLPKIVLPAPETPAEPPPAPLIVEAPPAPILSPADVPKPIAKAVRHRRRPPHRRHAHRSAVLICKEMPCGK